MVHKIKCAVFMFVVFGMHSAVVADCVPCKEKIAMRQSIQEAMAASLAASREQAHSAASIANADVHKKRSYDRCSECPEGKLKQSIADAMVAAIAASGSADKAISMDGMSEEVAAMYQAKQDAIAAAIAHAEAAVQEAMEAAMAQRQSMHDSIMASLPNHQVADLATQKRRAQLPADVAAAHQAKHDAIVAAMSSAAGALHSASSSEDIAAMRQSMHDAILASVALQVAQLGDEGSDVVKRNRERCGCSSSNAAKQSVQAAAAAALAAQKPNKHSKNEKHNAKRALLDSLDESDAHLARAQAGCPCCAVNNCCKGAAKTRAPRAATFDPCLPCGDNNILTDIQDDVTQLLESQAACCAVVNEISRQLCRFISEARR